eukprot:Skav224784  [mRNA]  locus=scaffold428:252344:254481:+ [translate_table: standard]
MSSEATVDLARLVEQFGQLSLDLQSLQGRVATLESEVSALRAAEPGFELVGAAEPAAAAAAPSRGYLSEERRSAAAGIGVWLRRCLEGRNRGPSGRDQIAQQMSRGASWLMADEEADLEEPELSEFRQQILCSGDFVRFDYTAGVYTGDEGEPLCAVIAVAEVDGAVLVALPEAAWDARKAKRRVPENFLRKAVRVMVAGCLDEDRTTPESAPSFRVWLGILNPLFEPQVYAQGEEPSLNFPSTADGQTKWPYAKALIAVAQDHFEFATATSQGQVDEQAALAAKVEQLEKQLQELLQPKAKARSTPPSRSAARPQAAAPLPPGVDPGVAQQALMAGMSPQALAEVGQVLRGQAAPGGPFRPPPPQQIDSDPEDEEDDLLGGDGGSQNPMELALVQLTKIVGKMNKDSKVKQDRSLEGLLDRAESGSAMSKDALTSTGSRSKAAAYRALKKALTHQPELIYTAIEERMQEDWATSSSLPGASAMQTVSARSWLEHRSRVQNYQSSVRASWQLTGIWDCLRCQRYAEARARTALAVATWDQQAIDRGSWVVAAALGLEDNPPFSSFAGHRGLESFEEPHTKLVDGRFLDLVLARLKDLSEFQERKGKLSSAASSAAPKDDQHNEKEKDKPKPKKFPKAKAKSKEEGKDPPPA